MPKDTPGTALATIDDSSFPITSKERTSALLDSMSENIGSAGLNVFDLDRVKLPSGGGAAWAIPTLEGKPRVSATMDGIIVAWRDPRAYWEKSLDETGGGIPPDCSSDDGEFGIGDPGGECARCPLSQFGSAPPKKGEEVGKGQACKQMRLLFMVQEGALLPTAIFLPPTSLAAIKKYFLGLTSLGYRYSDVVTSLALDQTKNQGGIEYSVIVPSLAGALSTEQRAAVREYSAALSDATRNVRLTADDVGPGEAPGAHDDGQ